MKRIAPLVIELLLSVVALAGAAAEKRTQGHVPFNISDDLTATALSCYGNPICQTPNIDRLAAGGTRFTRCFCQGTYCGPSRASFLSGYYPHATGVLGYTSTRPAIGGRAASKKEAMAETTTAAMAPTILSRGRNGSTAQVPSGRRPATAKRWKAIR